MNVYELELLSLINKELKKSESAQFIRIDYFNTPEIYLKIARELKSNYPTLNILLAEEKYNYWKDLNLYEECLQTLVQEGFVDMDTRLTKLRNDFGTEKNSYVLLGTEAVQDKGGLADFYALTPNDIEISLKGNYAKWFKCVDQENSSETTKVNNLFHSIFLHVPLDVMIVSDISQIADEEGFVDTEALLNYIIRNLWKHFKLPNFSEVNTSMRKDLEKKKTVSLINTAAKFIKREEYKTGLTPAKQRKIESKFINFKEEEQYLDFLPAIEATFGNVEQLERDIITFAMGENIENLRAKLAQFDFNIVAFILGIKKTGGTSKDTVVSVQGDPFKAYSTMLFHYLINKNFDKEIDQLNVTIKVESIVLADAILEEDKNKRWKEICIALGGIVEYLNAGLDRLNLTYDGDDLFGKQRFDDSIISFGGANKLSKIEFVLTSDDVEGRSKSQRYKWSFNSFEYWLQTFHFLPVYYEQVDTKMDKFLPIFTCNQIGNLLTSTDSDTFHLQLKSYEVLMHNYWDEVKGLADSGSIIFAKMFHLANMFPQFLEEVCQDGFYNYINVYKNSSLPKFIEQYKDSLETLYENYHQMMEAEKEYLYPITNLFTILNEKEQFAYASKIKGAIIPPLHPAMLEKIEAQQFYRRQGIAEIIDGIFEGNFKNHNQCALSYEAIMQQSSIISGVDTLLTINSLSRIPNKVLGYYALHGSAEDIIIDSANLLDITLDLEDEDQGIVLSAKSNIIKEHIDEYMRIFPLNVDTLGIAFVNFEYLHPIIEVVKHFVKKAEGLARKVDYKIHILSETLDYKSQNYMRVWLENNFNEDDDFKLEIFFNTFEEAKESNANFDLVFIENLMEVVDIRYSKGDSKKIKLNETKYPMVFNPMANSKRDGTRNVSVSQPQFITSFAHSQLVFWLENENSQQNILYNVEKVLRLRESIGELLDYYHEHARWVISIDTGLDKSIYKEENIISFSTGEGAYGELNVAISTSEKIRVDIMRRLQKRLRKLFPSWQNELYEQACTHLLREIKHLDGIKVLKALNPNDYEIHSFLAGVLATHSLEIDKIDTDVILKSFISLDSYDHWFVGQPNRPDYLELKLKTIDEQAEKIVIEANLVECKMGRENAQHVDKGITQLTNGLMFLKKIFSPESTEYNRRYWYAQLYRLLAFSPNFITNDVKQKELLNIHLTKILNAEFEIEWNTTLLTYWLDINSEEMESAIVNLESGDTKALHKSYGQLYIQKYLLPEEQRETVSYDVSTFEEIKDFADDEETFNEILKTRVNEYDDSEDDYEEGIAPVNVVPNGAIRNVSPGLASEYTPFNPSIDLPSVAEEQPKLNTTDNTQEIRDNDKPNEDQPVEQRPLNEAQQETAATNVKKLEDIRILLGTDQRGQKFYWEFGHPKLENRHLLISGKSGVGKTYFMQCLLLELTRNNISSLIFDYTDGFKKSKLETEFKEELGDKLVQFHVMKNGFPINPFKKNKKEIDEDEYDDENDVDVAERIKSVFNAVYKSTGPQQANAIYRATLNGLRKYKESMNLEFLRAELEALEDGSSKTILARIEPLLDRKPFDTNSVYNWEEHRKKEGIVFVVQLSGFTREVQLIITEFILWDLWNFNLSHGSVQKPFPVILDEAQNLDHSETSPSAKILTEGRKFGWSGWYATQFMEGQMNKDEIRRLQQASQRVYFQPPDDEVMSIAGILTNDATEKKEWANKLSKLGKGRCIIAGPSLQEGTNQLQYLKPRIIDVTPLGERKE